MAVEAKASGTTFEPGIPKPLFDTQYVYPGPNRDGPFQPYAVSPDGQRFLILRPAGKTGETAPSAITVVLNWTAAINK